MSKTKSSSKGAEKASSKALGKVKDAAITKPSQTPKAKSKEIAKKVVAKEEKSKKKKGKKSPTPEPSSESESDSDEEMGSPDASSSESESEDEKPAKKVAAKAKAPAAKVASDSESESDSDDGSSSEEEKVVAKPKAASSDSEESESSESESDSESSSDDSSSEGVPAKVTKKAAEVNGAKKASSDDSSDDDSAESSEGSSDGSDEDSDESADEAPKTQKRKAEADEAPASKKTKTEETSVDAPGSGNLFVGNLSWNVDEEWLRQEFEEFGELTGARIVTERDTGRSRGFGYVEFAKAADAAKAHAQKKDVEIDGRKINLDFANARTTPGAGKDRAQSRAQSFGDQTSPESDTLFVGNIAFSANEDSLHNVFADQGSIVGIRLPTDPESGRPKGFGYVQFSSVDEARSALNALHGSDVDGRPIRLDFSTPRQNTGDSPRGGRGGGRGGGGRGFGGGFGDRGGRGGRGGGRGAPRGGSRGGSTNRGGFGDFSGKKTTF